MRKGKAIHMQPVIFIGDKPSSRNVDPNVAFVGTPSYKVLLNWIADLKLSVNNIKIYNKDSEGLQSTFGRGAIYIALGNNAAERMERSGWPYFKLPHPSPRNRKLNDKKYINGQLKLCKEYIHGT